MTMGAARRLTLNDITGCPKGRADPPFDDPSYLIMLSLASLPLGFASQPMTPSMEPVLTQPISHSMKPISRNRSHTHATDLANRRT